MCELLKRVFASPAVAFELVTATLMINVLALAGPIFVMQVLNRYVSQGVDATLATLTAGVLIAIVLEFLFRRSRMSLARGVNVSPDEKTAITAYRILTGAKAGALEKIPPDTRREMVNGVQAVEQAYNANNITAILDVPFSFIFVFVLYLLSPVIAAVVLAFIIGVFALGVAGSLSLQGKTQKMNEVQGAGSALISTATREQDTVRSFNAAGFLRRAWVDHVRTIQKHRRDVTDRQGLVQTLTQSANGLLSVAVMGVGAVLVVAGDMDVGAMMGANILGARALQPISKFSQLGSAFAKARQSLAMFRDLDGVPLEPDSGAALTQYKGAVEFRDVAFGFEGAPIPLFESLNLKLEPGSILLVTGSNSAGKTTLARLILGLIEPNRGQILADGLDLKQLAPEWWRRQVIYQPQEPALLNGTIAQNIMINAPDLDPESMDAIINLAGLRRFLDESPQGLDSPVVDNGWRLSEGVRRRLSLARGLATRGMLAVIDEPTESLDAEGVKAVHVILGRLVQAGHTIILMAHDPNIIRGPHWLLDLNEKPVPALRRMEAAAQPAEGDAAAARPEPAPQSAPQPAPKAASKPASSTGRSAGAAE